MRREIFYLGLLLFCFQTGCFGNPVQGKHRFSIYSYKGQIDTRTSACDESLARWTISGNLSLYKYPNYMIAKLDNVKTIIFNGPKTNLQHVQEKEIPEEAKILQQPFVLKQAEDSSLSVVLKPGEPLWSVNMKKAIANLFDEMKPIVSEEGGSNDPDTETYDGKSLQDNCDSSYIINKSEEEILYEKKINGWGCLNKPVNVITNTYRAPRDENLVDVLDFQTVSTMIVKKTRGDFVANQIKKITKIAYKTMPSTPYAQHIDQLQEIDFLDMSESEESIDITEVTEHRDLIYEFADDPTSGRHTYETDPSALTEQFMEHYTTFDNIFSYSTPEHFDIRKGDHVDAMFMILMVADMEALKNIENAILLTEDNNDIGSFYCSLLPYIGTNTVVRYLNNYIQSENVNSSNAFALRILATLPHYIQYPIDEMLVELEPMMNIKHTKQQTVKNAGILSFAATVDESCRKKMISKKYMTKYINLYNQKFLDGDNYEERMTYLLGLVNMGECITPDIINSITTNTSESSHLRALALTGFKDTLVDKSKDIYEVYWPIVQKKSEPFEVRVLALELLLSAALTEEQFNTIIKKYNRDLNEPEDKQLANFLLTSLHSIQNTTGYIDNLGSLASEAIKTAHIPSYPQPWATANYRISYTDSEPNLGSSLEMRLITNPVTNIANAVQVSFNSFGMSFDFGTYTIYFKFNEILENFGVSDAVKYNGFNSVPELIKLLKDNNFGFKTSTKDVHVEIVLFINGFAVYNVHTTSLKMDDIKIIGYGSSAKADIGYELDDYLSSKFVSYPVMEYVHIPSDLGTTIQLSNYMQDISKHEIDAKNYIKYRSSWYFQTWMEAYNPLIDANIASFKYYNDEKNLNVKVIFKKSLEPTIIWDNENETYSQFWDNMMGTAVEEKEILKEYCGECDAYLEILTDDEMEYPQLYSELGFDTNNIINSHKRNNKLSTVLSHLGKETDYLYNADALPQAAPILFIAHGRNHKFWLKSELTKGSIISKPLCDSNETITTRLDLSLHGTSIARSKFRSLRLSEVGFKLSSKNSNDEILSAVNVTYNNFWYSHYRYENDTIYQLFTNTLNFTIRGKGATEHVKLYATRDIYLPDIKSDKWSLSQYEAVTGETEITTCKNIDDDEECIPHKVFLLTETFSSSDKSSILEDPRLLKDYEQCKLDSKGLKFTAPTTECKRVSLRLTEYDKYKADLKWTTFSEDSNQTEQLKLPLFQRYRTDENHFTFLFLYFPFKTTPNTEFSNYSLYFPQQLFNPSSLGYDDTQPEVQVIQKSTCTITPSAIEQFSGKYIPNKENEWIAFGEFYDHNISTRALIGHTVDDKHVGFKFWSSNNTFTATTTDGKLELKVNGKEVTEDYYESDITIYFLDKNVVHIHDQEVEIYYNTEYVSVRIISTYYNLLTGLCTEENQNETNVL